MYMYKLKIYAGITIVPESLTNTFKVFTGL